MANRQYSGTIDLGDFTTTAYVPAVNKGVTASYNSFKESGLVLMQIGSADISGAVTCNLQVSADGAYWANAQEDGSDITFSLNTTTPIVQLVTGASKMLYRVAITINSKTGNVDYVFKDL